MTLQEQFIQSIKAIFPSAKLASGGKEIQCNCPYCGDKERKFYISIPRDDMPALYNCFHARCQRRGIVTSEVLNEWGIHDPNININLSAYNREIASYSKNAKYLSTQIYYLTNKYINPSKLSEIKLKYINKRLGLHLTYQDLLDNKIVLNLYDLLNSNGIHNLTRYKTVVDEIDESFIGFISADNAFINMRNLREGKVSNTIDKKYINYDIFGKYDNTHRFYIIPCNIDTRYPIKLRIAEGCFDILSIKYNVVTDHNNTIFAAICGASYSNMIKYFITHYGFVNLEIHIYKDNDVPETIFRSRDMYNILKLGYPVYIHSNTKSNEKDYGVPRDRIIDSSTKINL